MYMPALAPMELGEELNDQQSLLETLESSSQVTVGQCIDASSTSFQRRLLLPLALGNAADAAEILSVGYIMTVFSTDGRSLSAAQKEGLTAAVFIGMLAGGLLAGFLADAFGRRRCLLISLAVNLAFALLSAAAPSVGWLIAARIFAGSLCCTHTPPFTMCHFSAKRP